MSGVTLPPSPIILHGVHRKQFNFTRSYVPAAVAFILPSSGLLRGISLFKTDVSELPIGPILKGQAVQVEGEPDH